MTISKLLGNFAIIACLTAPMSLAAQSLPSGEFSLTTQFRKAEGECLEGNQINGALEGAAFMDSCQNVSGQLWRVIPAEGGYFRLTTQFREPFNECLEGNRLGGDYGGAAFMATCQNVTGQLWSILPAPN